MFYIFHFCIVKMYWFIEGTAYTHSRSIIRFFALLIYAFLCSEIRWPTILHVRLVSCSQWFRTTKSATLVKCNELFLVFALSSNRTKLFVSGVWRSAQSRHDLVHQAMQWNHKIQIICEIRDGKKSTRRGREWERLGTMVLFVVHFVISAWINALNKVTNGIRQMSLVHSSHRIRYIRDRCQILKCCTHFMERVEIQAAPMRHSRNGQL